MPALEASDGCGRFSIVIDTVVAILLCIAAYIKSVSRGPVLYRQRRYGLHGRPFKVWKFRTMEVIRGRDRHRSHVTELMRQDRTLEKRDRELPIIPLGQLMRKYGVDELPQLINVWKGEMSLVGPRPDVIPFSRYARLHRRRFEVLPGLTGLWQVNGKNRTTFSTMMRLDLAYVRRRSFWLDVTILLLTIPALAWE
jgi:lipopolysaccharide/colanic/teichoic acid biosynthesis glycosyltransferase